MLGWGIVGCADIAKKFVRSIKQCSHSRLVAIGSRSIEKAQQFAQECEVTQGVQVYGSYQQVLDDPYVQAVYLPLPTTLHLEWVTLAANAGKHILIEKPVALSAEDFQKMILVCKQNNVFIMDGTMFMHHPRTAALQEILQTPEAGIMRRVNACFNFSTDAEFLQTNIRVKSDGDPLGVLGDLGWYCIRLGIVAFSRGSKSIAQPVKCTARCSKWNDQRIPLEVWATVFFSEDESQMLSFSASFLLPICQSYEIHLLRADSLHSDQTISCHDFVLPYSAKEGYFTRDVSPLTDRPQNHQPDPHEYIKVSQEGTQEILLIDNFSKLILSGDFLSERDYWTQLSLTTQAVVDACRVSLYEGSRDVEVVAYSSIV